MNERIQAILTKLTELVSSLAGKQENLNINVLTDYIIDFTSLEPGMYVCTRADTFTYNDQQLQLTQTATLINLEDEHAQVFHPIGVYYLPFDGETDWQNQYSVSANEVQKMIDEAMGMSDAEDGEF